MESGQEGRGDPKGQRARPVRGSLGVKVCGGTPGSFLSLEPLRNLPTHTHVQMTHKRGGTPEDQRVIQRVEDSTGGYRGPKRAEAPALVPQKASWGQGKGEPQELPPVLSRVLPLPAEQAFCSKHPKVPKPLPATRSLQEPKPLPLPQQPLAE